MFNPSRVAVLFRYSIPQVLPVAIVIQSFQDCFVAIVCIFSNFFNDRSRPVSRKIREDGVKNYPCLSDKGASLDDSAVRKPNFSSKSGAVLTFFDYFFVSRQKRNWGFRGNAPRPKSYHDSKS